MGFKAELLLIQASAFGFFLYFFTANLALKYTSVSNASLLLPLNVLITGILSFLIFKKALSKLWILGFFVSFLGLFIVLFGATLSENFSFKNLFSLNGLFGDMLCLVAALFWSIYMIFMQKILSVFKDANALALMRRLLFYALIFNFFSLLFLHELPSLNTLKIGFQSPINSFNLLFLGIMTFGISFVTWNEAMKRLGALKASAYYYVATALSVTMASFVLGENLSWFIFVGGALTLLGAFLSQK